ncbi:MAG: class I tRNA ligase family protein [Gemmatimonadetes bacterium]|nr:class I tRNA ligase family protein [Gemmatimonadota bacterium]
MAKFYITTAIDYSNGEPHIGHAFEKLGADCIARYRRLRGDDVHFVIGMDEHGQNVLQAAEKAGTPPGEWVDRIADMFQETWREFHISNTDFIRTTEERHTRCVTKMLERILAADDIYEGNYEGFYCVSCEAFKLDKDLDDGSCPEHPNLKVAWVEEPNFFFKLSKFADELLQLYESNPDFLRPPAKMNEIRNIVQSGLQDISVSRARVPWGIPWPGENTHTVYVWFDALINYLSATGFPDGGWEEMWPADLHVIGPDIARFHAVIWPAMLSSAALPLPRGVWSHGWVKTSGGRFSKTAGVRIELKEAMSRHGTDALRYFLLREVPWDADGNFSWERFDARYTSDLADGYGNLASRVLAMIVKYRAGKVPESGDTMSLDNSGMEALAEYADAMDGMLLHLGAQAIWRLVADANSFIEEMAPWTLAKEESDELLDATLASLARCLFRITATAAPFLPTKVREVTRALGLHGEVSDINWQEISSPRLAGSSVTKLAPLFPKDHISDL